MAIMYRFDPRKAIEVVLYIAQEITNIYHALKILYFADKDHLAKYGRLICGDSYVAMRLGPVPSGTYDLVKCVRGDGWWALDDYVQGAFEVKGNDICPSRKPDTDLLSASDRECLDEAIAHYGHLPFRKLLKLSHDDKAFKAADTNDFIPLEEIIQTLPDSELLRDYLAHA